MRAPAAVSSYSHPLYTTIKQRSGPGIGMREWKIIGQEDNQTSNSSVKTGTYQCGMDKLISIEPGHYEESLTSVSRVTKMQAERVEPAGHEVKLSRSNFRAANTSERDDMMKGNHARSSRSVGKVLERKSESISANVPLSLPNHSKKSVGMASVGRRSGVFAVARLHKSWARMRRTQRSARSLRSHLPRYPLISYRGSLVRKELSEARAAAQRSANCPSLLAKNDTTFRHRN